MRVLSKGRLVLILIRPEFWDVVAMIAATEIFTTLLYGIRMYVRYM